MSIVRLLSLDSSTWGELARLYPANASAQHLLGLLQEGGWTPFLTHHHLEEIFGHQDDELVKKRSELLGSLKLVCYIRSHRPGVPVGDIMTLQIREIETALSSPNASLQEIVDRTTSKVVSVFSSGRDLMENGREFFELWRNFHEGQMQRRAMVAGLTHFEYADRNKKLPGPSELVIVRPLDEAQPELQGLRTFLEDNMSRYGDKRLDPQQALSTFSRLMEATRNRFPAGPGVISVAQVLRGLGLEYSELPPNPTQGDFLDEIEFQSQCRLLEEAACWPTHALRGRIRQNQLPSRMIIREIERVSKGQGRAFASNFNDVFIAAFSPYVQRIEVDKRTLEFGKRAARNSPFLCTVQAKMFRKRGLPALARELERADV